MLDKYFYEFHYEVTENETGKCIDAGTKNLNSQSELDMFDFVLHMQNEFPTQKYSVEVSSIKNI